ncbi:MAG: LOG family protein [Opitutales bacterium]|nr:LOG family protein [Opitutales bacterium]
MNTRPLNEPPKAYKNIDFLNSSAARKIRVLCEMTEPEDRFKRERVEDTIVMFGSARIRPPEEAKAALATLEKSLPAEVDPKSPDGLALRRARAGVKAAPYYTAAMDLAEKVTRWSKDLQDRRHRFIVCSGGGPGIMEAANRGAAKAAGLSVGLGISLPFEQGINEYVSRELGFEFHYFFVRKYWFMYLAKALIVFPGGFGTMDELFETLTLIQTRKITKPMPIVLFGSEFWNDILNFEKFIEWGVISPEDIGLFRIIDSVDEAYEFLVAELTKNHLTNHAG